MWYSVLARAWKWCAIEYARRPAAITLLCSIAALAIVWCRPFFLGAVIPYDYQTAHYPWYVDAVRAARYNPFCLYNPFNDAGQLVWNLAAFNDPTGWLPALGPFLPGYTTLQSIQLLHLALIPGGLLLVARANDVPRQRWIWIVGISVIAYAVGPTLKFMQGSPTLVAYACAVFVFGSLEAFRTTGERRYALLAGASIAYLFEATIYPAIFLPIALAGYAVANGRQLWGTRDRIVSLAFATLVLALIVAPSLLMSLKIDRTIDIAHHLIQQNKPLTLRDIPAMLGTPAATFGLLMLPAGLVALVCAGYTNLSRRQMIAYGIVLAILIVYAFGDNTPFAGPIRALYPPAGLIRRPYSAWYIILPFFLVLATIGLRGTDRRVVLRLATAASALALIAGLAIGGIPMLATITVALTLVVTLWQPRTVVVVPLAVVQWLAIDWLPFSNSIWQPQPIPVVDQYDAPLHGLEPYRGGPASRSGDAFRIANIGLPAMFGPSAGMFQIYNVAADWNTFIPHSLVRELGTPDLHGMKLMPYAIAHPDMIGSPPWERLATKYYFVGPTVFSAVAATVAANRHLHVLPVSSAWQVIEDDVAAPFVAGVRADGSLVPIDAGMTRDTFAFTVPPGVETVRFAVNFDSWWHASDRDKGAADLAPADDNGQLTLGVGGRTGHRISLIFTDRVTVAAIGCSIVTQLVFFTWLCMPWLSAWRTTFIRRYGVRPDVGPAYVRDLLRSRGMR